jgi:hypothetical protein
MKSDKVNNTILISSKNCEKIQQANRANSDRVSSVTLDVIITRATEEKFKWYG